MTAIRKSSKTTLPRFLFALGIRDVGEVTARNLAIHFGELTSLMRADEDELMRVTDVGPTVAKHVHTFFKQPRNLSVVENLIAAGVSWDTVIIPNDGPTPFAGKTFVVTGTLTSMTREQAHERILSLGGKTTGSVSKKTSYVIVGTDPGSKAQKAETLGVPILDENGFLSLLDSPNQT